GYYFLLTDRYPPFSMNDVAYPVSLSLDGPPPKLNRFAVFFRLLLVVPANFLEAFFGAGLYVVMFVAWCIAPVIGRVPRPVHLTLAAGLRSILRINAYLGLLTPEYPWGLLGDPQGAVGTLEGGTLALHGGAKKLAIATLVFGVFLYLSYWALAI